MLGESKSADIVETLEAILAHKIFAASPKAQDFLRHIITETLAGREETLSGVTIAQDVFQKDSNFDPAQDSVVRVTARRVRYMLQDYYSQRETTPAVIITIPKGKYKPHFEYTAPDSVPDSALDSAEPNGETKPHKNDASNLSEKPRQKKIYWAAGIVAALIVIFSFGLSTTLREPSVAQPVSKIAAYPSIAIIPFTNQTDDAGFNFLERGLQKQMTKDLSRFELIRPIAYDKSYEALLKEASPLYDYTITGIILGVEPEIDLYIKLIDLKQANIIFEDRIRRAPGQSNYYDSLVNMVSKLSSNFAGFEGVIVKERLGDIQNKIAKDTEALADLNLFECNSLITQLLENPTPELYKTIYTCLDTFLQEDPENDMLLASFGWLTYVGATSHEPVLMARAINPNINADKGFAMIEKAVTINSENTWAQQTLSSLKIHKGDIQGALNHAELAVWENPANPDNLTWLAQCLANAGEWDRAMAFAQEAIDRNPDPTAHYYYPFFLKGLHDGDVQVMSAAAKKLTNKDHYYAKLYSYLATIADNDKSLAKTLKPYIDEIAKRNGNDIMSVIATRMPSKDLQQKAERLILKGEAMFSQTSH